MCMMLCKYHRCLPRHVSLQPWAQLLVLGIKRIEGRGWPSLHRGRLWIHATAQHPSSNTVQASSSGSIPLGKQGPTISLMVDM